MQTVNRVRNPGRAVALETTLILHGVPRADAANLAAELSAIVTGQGAEPALVGIIRGTPTIGLTDAELLELLEAAVVAKANTSNLGVILHRREHGATTVSTTMELAAGAGVRVFATGGIGGVHRGYATALDISADLAAFTRFPVAVVTSGVKSLLDVVATREALEALGVPVVGFQTERFPAFYLRESEAGVDARFDDESDLAAFVGAEVRRTGRGVVVANPIPAEHAVAPGDWNRWLAEASRQADAEGVRGRGVTPFILGRLHEISERATLRANVALVKANARLAGALCRRMA
jgi:pseudouridine-5'-phosphate glycosidase